MAHHAAINIVSYVHYAETYRSVRLSLLELCSLDARGFDPFIYKRENPTQLYTYVSKERERERLRAYFMSTMYHNVIFVFRRIVPIAVPHLARIYQFVRKFHQNYDNNCCEKISKNVFFFTLKTINI